MTRDETIEAIKVMQAWVDGKAIQYNIGGAWGDLGHIDDVNWRGDIRWRIKPEPLVAYVTVWDNRDYPFGGAYASRAHAETSTGGIAKVVRFVESPE